MKKIYIFSFLLLAILGCKKKTNELPSPETPVIEVTQVDGNTFIFKNATPSGGASSLWDFGGIESSSQYKDTIFFAYKGSYTITLTSNSKGGISKSSTVVNVENTSPFAADFTVERLDDFHFEVQVTTPKTLSSVFNYSIGLSDSSLVDTVYFPFSGNQTISLTVEVSDNGVKRRSILTKTVNISNDDMSNPDLNDPVFIALTGGFDDLDGKTWVVSPTAKLSGVGPWSRLRYDLSWYDYPDGLENTPSWVNGILSNEFTFIMRGYQFVPKNQNATANWLLGNIKLGMQNAQYADKEYQDPNLVPATFNLKAGAFAVRTDRLLGYGLNFNNKAHLGYFQNRTGYEVCKISATKDSMWVRQKYNDNPDDYKTRPEFFNDPANDPGARTFLLVEKK